MSRQSISVQTLTVQASGAIVAHRFVTPVGAQAGAAANTLGVARTLAVDGEYIPVDVLGTALAEAGGAIAAGAAVETDASGRAVTLAVGEKVGRLAPGSSASQAGDMVEVILIPN